MKEIAYNEKSEILLDIMKKGAFLTTKTGDKVNTMTIGWGNIGYSWGKPIFTAMVRKSRLTHDILEKSNEFTLTFPTENLKETIALCGSKSGRDIDKIAESGLKILPSLKIQTPTLDLKGIHFECTVLYKTDMNPQNLHKNTDDAWYQSKDYHTFYFAEILSSYLIE